jgi:methionyl-tRNA formyltransferase
MKLILIGAVEGTKVAFDALVAAELAPTHIVTLPLEKAARHSDFVDLTEPALEIGAKVIYCNNINDDATIKELEEIQPDLCLVLGWSQICHAKFRSIARLGNIGFHPSPLPKLRGRAVIPWTILLNMHETAASLFMLEDGADTGDIVAQEFLEILPGETARSLYDKQTNALAKMLPDAVRATLEGTMFPVPQEHSEASYCAKRTPADGEINWLDSAAKIERFIRAVGAPYPGAFTSTPKNGRLWIDAAKLPDDPVDYIGIPGQIQAKTTTGFIILCGDYNCIEVREWRTDTSEEPHQHAVLGR